MHVAQNLLNILDKTHTCTYSDMWPTPPSYYTEEHHNPFDTFSRSCKNIRIFSPSQGFPVGDGRRQRQVPPGQGRPGGDTVAGRAVHAEERGQAQVMTAKNIYFKKPRGIVRVMLLLFCTVLNESRREFVEYLF